MKNFQKGFTLLELIATIAIAGILSSMAAPAMNSFAKKSRMTTFTNELVSSIQIARSHAIKNSSVACICPTSDATAAVPVCDSDDNWESGWIAFTDSSGDCNYNPGDTVPDRLLKAVGNNGFENFTVRNNNASINSLDFIRFNSRGAPQQENGALQQGMFSVCDERGYVLDANGDTVPRGIILSAAGSLRSTKNAALLTACP